MFSASFRAQGRSCRYCNPPGRNSLLGLVFHCQDTSFRHRRQCWMTWVETVAAPSVAVRVEAPDGYP